jgi:hypothetical protein
MAQWKKISLVIFGGVAAVVVAGVWLFQAFVSDMCANKFLSEIPSPDGALKVVVFQRDCGATTGYSTHISVVQTNRSLPNESGNLFVADSNRNKSQTARGGGLQVRVTWIGTRSLRIAHHQEAGVFLANRNVFGVSAEYVSFR